VICVKTRKIELFSLEDVLIILDILYLRGEFKRPKLLSDNRILYVVSQFRSFDTDANDARFVTAIAIFPTNNANVFAVVTQ